MLIIKHLRLNTSRYISFAPATLLIINDLGHNINVKVNRVFVKNALGGTIKILWLRENPLFPVTKTPV